MLERSWDRERTAARVDSNDIPNARIVAATAAFADRVIASVDDGRWASA